VVADAADPETVLEETLQQQGMLARRLRLAPGETTPRHRDPFHRVTAVLGGDVLAIDHPDPVPQPGEE